MTSHKIMLETLAILTMTLLTGNLSAKEQKTYDFEFKDMDIKKVVASIAKLEDKNVMFSKGVEPREVEVSLTDVTAQTALHLILENYGYVEVLEENVIHVMLPTERTPASSATVVVPLRHVLAKEIE